MHCFARKVILEKLGYFITCSTIIILGCTFIYRLIQKTNYNILDGQENAVVRKKLLVLSDEDICFRRNRLKEAPEEDESVENKNSTVPDWKMNLKKMIGKKCSGRRGSFQMQRGNYWVLHNFIKSTNRYPYHKSITYTTHADYSSLDNLVNLVTTWNGPVSIALYAPSKVFNRTLDAIHYLRDCTTQLIKRRVDFHIYFDINDIPHAIPKSKAFLQKKHNCESSHSPEQVDNSELQPSYPVNVGRNIARESADTYFVLASDIEMYPTPNLTGKFFEMLTSYPELLNGKPRVFVLNVFEVAEEYAIPDTKTQLQQMLLNETAERFRRKVCKACPMAREWMVAKGTNGLRVFRFVKRKGIFSRWHPVFIGTQSDPLYDERFTWKGIFDKTTQGYILCMLDYDFLILDNAFLVHRPTKSYVNSNEGRKQIIKTKKLIKEVVTKELHTMYDVRNGCDILL